MSLFTQCKSNVYVLFDGRSYQGKCISRTEKYVYRLTHIGNVNYFSTPHNIQIVESLPSVTFIACGRDHVIYQINPHMLYVQGNNQYGQLGLGDQVDRDKPTKLDLYELIKKNNIIHISCGKDYTFILLDSGNCYSWGDNTYYQLSILDKTEKVVTIPTMVNFPKSKKIIYVTCGDSHTLFITGSNDLYGCGSNMLNQLGTGSRKKKKKKNHLKKDMFGFVKIIGNVWYVCAQNDRSLALTYDKKFYVWGTHKTLGNNFPDFSNQINRISRVSFYESIKNDSR